MKNKLTKLATATVIIIAVMIIVQQFGVQIDGTSVAWGQVVDYFDDDTVLPARYVFFYLDPTDVRRRLELTVPRSQRAAFQQVVREKLDARFDLSAQQVYGKKALEG